MGEGVGSGVGDTVGDMVISANGSMGKDVVIFSADALVLRSAKKMSILYVPLIAIP